MFLTSGEEAAYHVVETKAAFLYFHSWWAISEAARSCSEAVASPGAIPFCKSGPSTRQPCVLMLYDDAEVSSSRACAFRQIISRMQRRTETTLVCAAACKVALVEGSRSKIFQVVRHLLLCHLSASWRCSRFQRRHMTGMPTCPGHALFALWFLRLVSDVVLSRFGII